MTEPSNACPFCARIRDGTHLESSEYSVAFGDGFPLNPGHTLVVPRRHVPRLSELSGPELHDIWQLTQEVRQRLQEEQAPDGFNIGVNEGPAAGQTIEHAHLHVIPRYEGDVDDPRGGVRWVLPEGAAYWRDP